MLTNLHIYSGLGNVIAIIDAVRSDLSIDSTHVTNICSVQDINFDQLLVVLPPQKADIDLDVKIYNKDGSLALNCINGARCLAKFIKDNDLLVKECFDVQTDGGIWNLEIIDDTTFTASFTFVEKVTKLSYEYDENDINLSCLDLGNPHGVTFESLPQGSSFVELGKDLQNSDNFPEGINFGVAQIISEDEINLRVYERGAGETLACGSGACAAAVLGIIEKNLVSPVKVNFKLGSLLVDYQTEKEQIRAEGKAEFLEIKEIYI